MNSKESLVHTSWNCKFHIFKRALTPQNFSVASVYTRQAAFKLKYVAVSTSPHKV